MDPLSITVASISLVKLCSTIAVELGIFVQSTKDIDSTIAILQGDVQDFRIVLELLNDTVGNQDVKDWIASSGRIDTYWTSLGASLRDAATTLNSLKTKTEIINKSARIFDTIRKQMRMKFAAEEIVMYRQQIARFKGTVQVVLNTTTIWHHASDKQASQQVLPRLDETQIMIRELGVQFNKRMAALQGMIHSQPISNSSSTDTALPPEIEYQALDNMRNCLRGAATVIVSASTVAGDDAFDDSATIHGSDFGDIFPSTSSDQTLNWIRENAIPEQVENDVRQERSSIDITQSFGELEVSGESDDDQGLEWEMRIVCFQLGSQRVGEGRLGEAETHLANSVDGLLEDQVLAKAPTNWLEFIMNATLILSEVLYHLNKWKELQTIYKKRLYISSRLQNRGTEMVIADKLHLSRALFECEEYQESLLYCRSAELEYRKLGESELHGRISALRLIAKVHRQLGSEKEAQRSETLAEHLSSKNSNISAAKEIKSPKPSNLIDAQVLKESLLGSDNKVSASNSTPLPASVFDSDDSVIKKSIAKPKTELTGPVTVADAVKESASFQVCRRAKVIFDFKGRDDHELSVLEDDQLAILCAPDEEYYAARSFKDEREGEIPKTYVEILEGDVWIEAYKVDYSFTAKERDELSVEQDNHVHVLKREPNGWWLVMLRATGQQGWIPTSYISPYMLQEPNSQGSRPDAKRVRCWKDTSGAFAVDAEFRGFKNGDVCLQKVNGVMIALSCEKLSATDLKYLEDQFRQNLWA